MKFFSALLLTALLSFIGGIYFPWWTIAVAAFIAGIVVKQKPFTAFLASFLGVFLLWSLLAWWMDTENASLLSGKIGQLLGIGSNSFLLISITGVVGGLVGGFAALTASFLRSNK